MIGSAVMTQAEQLLNGRPRALSTDEVIEFFNALPPHQATAGPLTIEAKVSPGMGQVVVKLALAGREIGRHLLGYTEQVLILISPTMEPLLREKSSLSLEPRHISPHWEPTSVPNSQGKLFASRVISPLGKLTVCR
tara:strand:+ start:1448 stop:1855 length:408 start_codon:yes stop_codon:yes gene_type:complete